MQCKTSRKWLPNVSFWFWCSLNPEFLADFESRFFCADETYIKGYEPPNRSDSAEWRAPGEPSNFIPRLSKASSNRRMASIFMGPDGFMFSIVHPDKTHINGRFLDINWLPLFLEHVFAENLRKFRADVNESIPSLASVKIYLMLDNVRCHHTPMIKRVMAELNIENVPHPANSPDIMPLDFLVNADLKVRIF